MRKNDIFACYTILPPQGARKPSYIGRRAWRFQPWGCWWGRCRVILSGMKMLGTSTIFSNETWVGNLLPLAPNQLKSPLHVQSPEFGRYRYGAETAREITQNEFDAPLTWCFDGKRQMVILICSSSLGKGFRPREAEMSRAIYVQSPSHSMKSSIKYSFFGET